MVKQQKSILMAIIGGPHGIKGEVRLKSFSEDPDHLRHYQPLYDAQGQHFKIVSLRVHKNKLIVQFDGVTTCDEAQALRGRQLFVARHALDDDLAEDEFYHADLLGFSVVALDADVDAEKIGDISGFFNFGAGELVEIRGTSGKSWLIPFSKAAVPVIDQHNRQIKIDMLAAGLIEQEDELD